MKAPTVSEESTCRRRNWIFAESLGFYFPVGYHPDFTAVQDSVEGAAIVMVARGFIKICGRLESAAAYIAGAHHAREQDSRGHRL